MTMTTATTILLCLATAARAALAVSGGDHAPAYNASVRPLVIWHGMGDSANSSGMADFAERIREMHPGIFVHSVRLADDEKDDQRAGFVCPFCAGAEQVLTHHCAPASSGMLMNRSHTPPHSSPTSPSCGTATTRSAFRRVCYSAPVADLIRR
jgi:hypothetical protein